MKLAIVISFVILWCLIGMKGFLFWWTQQFDWNNEQIPTCIAASILGPFAYLAGWIIHGKDIKNGIVFKKDPHGR